MNIKNASSEFSSQSRNSGLDFLRGAAAFTVAISHYLLWDDVTNTATEQTANIAVEVFFILSGFVLAPQILRCLRGGTFRQDFRIFLLRRWFRTIPPYIVALVAITLISSGASLRDFVFYLIYIQNFFGINVTEDYFGIAWSLSVEEWFYVIFPVFLFVLHLKFGISITWSALIFIVLVSLNRELFSTADNFDDGTRRIVIFRLDSITFGFVLYLWHRKLVGIHVIWLAGICLVALGLTFFSLGVFAEYGQNMEWLFFYLVPIFGSSLLLVFFKTNEKIFEQRHLVDFSRVVGKISYPVYLFHVTVISLMTINGLELLSIPNFLVYVGITGLVAYVFHVSFEQPILNIRPNYKNRGHEGH